ncbi:hypothetical protein [Methylobrevis pamukkalensis]|uniref:Uncharacterized protein n=1 Tax=Methylobrevis pamukkalensis TaxID=1439726 RepID=A0A1E3GY11_9HYPH|nr:hypothetical protein [Methylobrevis pamukkalensis]ODN68948.1 hypothetical protein A6302_03754 [Methylobrevis pamukkalensis]
MAETATNLPVETDKTGARAEREWMPFEAMRREVDRLSTISPLRLEVAAAFSAEFLISCGSRRTKA